jgi:hypothetical protein
MQKEIYIVKGLKGEDYPAFVDRMFQLSEILNDRIDPVAIRMTLTMQRPPLLSVIPFRSGRTAVFSVTGDAPGCRGIFRETAGVAGGYLVDEAVPVAYEKSWDDKALTPGVCLLTLFHKKPGLDQEEFLRRWHEGHTPLSMKLHPLWNYNRNVVKETTMEDSAWYDGIVEEQFRKAPDLLNPLRFFGPPVKVPGHMLEVLRDTRSFIDMKRIETYLAHEYHIRS